MVVLRVTAGTDKGKVYEVDRQNITMGRDRGGTVQILDQGVSRKHAEIFSIGELYFIRDLESRNGTFVNSEKVLERVLRFGDQIQIGNTTLVFEDRLARLRDSQAIVIDDNNGGGPSEDSFTPSQTLQMKLTDTVAGKVLPPTPDELSAESKRLRALVGISNIISSETNLSKILVKSAQQLGKAADADNVFVFQIKQADETAALAFELLCRYDRTPEDQSSGVSSSIIRDCLKNGRAVLTSDAGIDARFHAMASVVMKQIKSVICVPISGLGRDLGVVYVSNSHRADAFSPEDLELVSAVAVQLATTIQLLQLMQHSDDIFRNSIGTLVRAIEMREPFSEGRAPRIATTCLGMAKELGWATHECRNAWLSGMLFDIGSIPLSDRDREAQFTVDTRKNHYATELLRDAKGLDQILPAILDRKERWDGSGSPEGKSGDAISPLGQVLGLACEFDRLLQSGGANDGPLSEKDALLKVSKLADHQFPRDVVNALLLAFRRGKLSDQEEISFFDMLQ